MHLESVRDLKGSLIKKIEQTFAENFITPQSSSQYDAWILPGLGIYPTGKRDDYKLAVHINHRSELDLIKEKIELPWREVDIKITGNVYAQNITKPYYKRPLSIGISISRTYPSNAGTLGCFVQKRGQADILILSCNHVLANKNAQIGDSIIQPAIEDNGDPETECIAELQEFITLREDKANLVDAATAKVKSINEVERLCAFKESILLQDFYRQEYLEPQVVAKLGRTTDLTIGIINAFEMSRGITYKFEENRIVYNFEQLIAIEGLNNKAFSEPGDSGSIIIDKGGNAVGLLLGGTKGGENVASITYANPIELVCEKLNIELAHE